MSGDTNALTWKILKYMHRIFIAISPTGTYGE